MSDDDVRRFGVHVCNQWTAMWNGDVDLVEKIMAPGFILRYAQAGKSRPGLRFAAEGTAVVDLALVDGAPAGLVARPYVASFTDDDGRTVARSGTDTLRVTSGLIGEAWSVSCGAGGRTFHH